MSAPTFVTATAQTGYIELHYYAVGTGDHIEIWRSTPSEYGGEFIRLADGLPWITDQADPGDEPHFRDYNVASGKTYSYFLVAVDSGGVTAATATKSASVTLSTGWLHAVTKTASGNTLGSTAAERGAGFAALSLLDLIPHARQYELASTQYLLAGADLPTTGIGNIETINIGLTNRIPTANDTNRDIIRDIFDSRRYCCLRDTRGNKFFGQIVHSERYQATYTDIPLGFQVTDFSEAI